MYRTKYTFPNFGDIEKTHFLTFETKLPKSKNRGFSPNTQIPQNTQIPKNQHFNQIPIFGEVPHFWHLVAKPPKPTFPKIPHFPQNTPKCPFWGIPQI